MLLRGFCLLGSVGLEDLVTDSSDREQADEREAFHNRLIARVLLHDGEVGCGDDGSRGQGDLFGLGWHDVPFKRWNFFY